MKKLFLDHPQSVNETYLQHLLFSAKYSLLLLCGSFASFIHAFFPFLFQTIASSITIRLAKSMVLRKKNARPCVNMQI